jgi:hypothetical protein
MMGAGASVKVSEEEKKRNRNIDKMLAETRKQIAAVFKMLLLGKLTVHWLISDWNTNFVQTLMSYFF